MNKGPSQQHFLPETYLKHITKNNDGKNLHVLHLGHRYKKKIETKDSGNSLFKKKDFYDTSEFPNPKEIELFFAKTIEQQYNRTIREISKEVDIVDHPLKIRLLEWVFYSKIRSISWREMYRFELKNLGHDLDFESKELREEHLNIISNEKIFESVFDYYDKNLCSKTWIILKSPAGRNWITSDNPGFTVNVDGCSDEDKLFETIPNPLCTYLKHDTILYFPLTKTYCLKIQPYNQGDDVKLNLSNTPICHEEASEFEFKLINYWTFLTQQGFVVSSNREDLEIFEQANSDQE